MPIYMVVPFDSDSAKYKRALVAAAGDERAVFEMQSGGFLVHYPGTTQELSDAAGITIKEAPGTTTGSAIVTAMASYWGYGHADMWEWIGNRWGK